MSARRNAISTVCACSNRSPSKSGFASMNVHQYGDPCEWSQP